MGPIPWASITFASICAIGWFWDRYLWNKGRCRQCGNEWRYFDTDSQGGDGYDCAGGHHAWFSWPFVRPKR